MKLGCIAAFIVAGLFIAPQGATTSGASLTRHAEIVRCKIWEGINHRSDDVIAYQRSHMSMSSH